MSAEQNKVAVRRFIDEVFVKGNSDAVDKLVTHDFTPHSWGTMPSGAEPLKQATKRVHAGVTCPQVRRGRAGGRVQHHDSIHRRLDRHALDVHFGALQFARGADFLSAFDKPQRDAFTVLFLNLHHHLDLADAIFWGIWLIPFGLLVYRSRFLPRFLGVWLIVGCLGYLGFSFAGFLFQVIQLFSQLKDSAFE
jgi:hypothetical protein